MTKILNDQCAEWLAKRGIDLEVAVAEGLYSAGPISSKMQPHPEARWVAFPYVRDGEQVGTKYRYTVEKGFQQDKGSEQCLYRLDRLKGCKTIVICEGEMDCLSAIQAGYQGATSVPGGAPAETGKKAHAYYYDAKQYFDEADTVIIATDNDRPGAALFEDTIVALGRAKCKFVTYPDGCKDLNDVLVAHGIDAVRSVLASAQDVVIDGLYSPSQLPDLPPLEVFRVGLSNDFDHHVGIVKGQTSIWTGFANHGKSLLLKQVATNLAKRHGWVIAGAFLEDDIQRNFKGDIMRAWSGYREDALRPEVVEQFNDWYERHWVLMRPDHDDTVTLDWLRDRIEAAVIRKGADFIVIDPFTEIDLQMGGRESTHEVIGEVLTNINRFARRYNVHIAIIAHPKKPGQSGERFPPIGYDISGSAHWKNKPYLGVTVHRDPDVEGFAQVKVWKSKRTQDMGPLGDFYLIYDNDTACFRATTRDYYEACASDGGGPRLVNE